MQDLSQMSTEELLRMRQSAQQQPAPTRAPGIIRGPAKAPDPVTPVQAQNMQNDAERLRIAQEQAERDRIKFNQEQAKEAPSPAAAKERLARIKTALDNLRGLERTVSSSNMGTGSIVGQESFRAGEDFMGLSGWMNQTANNVAGSIEMVQGDLINQVRQEMEQSGTPIGVKGADTEKEASRLAASIANLAQTQDEGEFLVGLGRAREYYARRLAATIDELVASGEPIDAAAIIEDLTKSGASEDELDAVANAFGIGGGDDGPLRGRVTDTSPPEGGGPAPAYVPGTSELLGLAQGTGDIVQGVGDTVGMFTDPFARVLADTLGYDGSQMQSLGTTLREGVGLPQSAPGIVRNVNEFAAGGLVGGAAARGLSALASPGVTQGVLSTLGRTPIRDTVAGAGAGAGATAGQEVGGGPGAVVGALTGGVGGFSAANRVAGLSAGRTPNALAQAAGRQGVDLLPADAGGPVARAVTTGTRASPLSVGPVVAAAERQQGQFGEAVRRTAASQGEVVDTQAAGEAVKRGADDFIQKSKQRGNRLYERAAQQSRGVAIKPLKTVEAGRAAIARLRQNPAATPSEISALETFIGNIEGGVSIQGLRDARTKLSASLYDGNLRSTSEQAMWKGILSNVADDIDAGLRSVGRDDAANTFRVADRLWSERIDVIDKTLSPIVGKDGMKGGEQVLSAIESMARGQSGGGLRLSRLMAALPEAEAGNIRATLIDRLGRATPGAQDAQGQAFSASTFLTNWNKMTPQAKASMFPDKAARSNLNDLATIAEQTKRSQAMANTSNTGVAVTSINVIGGGAAAAANLPATLLGAGSIYLTGKLMASPQFARILATTSKMPPAQANRKFTEQLGVLATRQPSLAPDIDRLTRAINDNTAGSLAAEEQNQ